MLVHREECVDCGLSCIGDICRYKNVLVYYCDKCPTYKRADYMIDNDHFCEDCAKKYIQELFEELTISEQAEKLNVSFNSLND